MNRGTSRPGGRWTLFATSLPDPRLRLLCFPFAGGGASTYRAWGEPMAAGGVEVWPVQLPGRENRLGEPAMDDLPALVRLLADEFGEELSRLPYAFFGHSMGACIAYELVLEMRRRGLPEPARLIASAHRAPHWPSLGPTYHDLPKDEFLVRLKEYGGTPEEVFAVPDLLDLLVPLLQTDFALFERHRWAAGDPLGCPVTVLGGLDDTVSAEELTGWEELTAGPFEVRMVQGDHFYLISSQEQTIRMVRDLLTAAASGAG
ncbi:thioesterase II family protein [Nonomuraea sp. NPDC050451]|uniref:thioesterase II family protein n=1 Tax=Nonomuraea sp. NPDC050451 TaxID=3364364 RepID=UPI0037B7D7E3